jgi:hypothetical protein
MGGIMCVQFKIQGRTRLWAVIKVEGTVATIIIRGWHGKDRRHRSVQQMREAKRRISQRPGRCQNL